MGKRRQQILQKALEEGGCALFFSDPQFWDTMQPAFKPYIDRNFYYLTGIDQPGFCLMVDKEAGPRLYKDKGSEGLAEGSLYRNECRDMSKLEEDLWIKMKKAGSTAWFFTYEETPLKEKNKYGELAVKIAVRWGKEKLRNSYQLMKKLRQTKNPWEIENIKKAIDYTHEALEFTAKRLHPLGWEYEALADYDYSLARRNREVSFQMAASGPNATILHYLQAGRRAKAGELMLFDVGACSRLYSSDISRTYPVDGCFSRFQGEIYQIVLEAQQVAEEKLRPGVSFREIDNAVRVFYARALKAVKLIRTPEEVTEYYYHGIGHALGLYVHDPGSMDDIVEEDSVFTLEPGLYIREKGMGIRIEDNYLVTEHGVENLSAGIPKTIDEVERLMSG